MVVAVVACCDGDGDMIRVMMRVVLVGCVDGGVWW